MNPLRVLCACIIVNGLTSSYQIYKQAVENNALQVRVAELEDRITLEDEARREIQRLALEDLKKRREAACRKNRKQSL